MPEIPRFREGLYPFGGWTVHLADGIMVTAPSREELETCVREHLKCSEQEAKDFVDIRLCLRYPSSCEGGKATRNIGLPLADRASLYLCSFEGRKVTRREPAEVEERLAICAKCPANHGRTTPGCCGSPAAIESLAKEVAAEHGLKGVFGHGWCGVLGVNLVIAANLSDRFITEADATHDSLPQSCPYRAD